MWRMTEGDGKKLRDECWYRLCGEAHGACTAPRGKRGVIHFHKVRKLGPEDFEGGTLPMLKKDKAKDHFDLRLSQFNSWQRRRGGKASQPAGAPAKGLDAPAKWHGSEDEKERRKKSHSRGVLKPQRAKS